MSSRKPVRHCVREPVQVYVDPDDRRLLDSPARPTAVERWLRRFADRDVSLEAVPA